MPGKEVNHEVARSAGGIAIGTLSSRILGLFRDVLLGALFSRTVTDAWLVAFRIPNMFRRLFGEGALSVSFIPIFIGLLKPQDSPTEAQKLANGVFTLLFTILTSLTLLGIVFAPQIIGFIAGAEAYTSIPGKLELTITMTRIMMVFVLFICMYAYAMAILNSLKQFFLPAIAPVFFNIALIVAAVLPSIFHLSPTVLAWGVVAGGLLQMLILIPALIKTQFLPRFTSQVWTPEVQEVGRKMLPGFLGMGVLQITVLVNTYFASTLEEGSNSWIYWADRLLELPLSLFAVSLGSALLPTLSGLWRDGKGQEMFMALNENLRFVMFLSVPSALGLFFLAEPIVQVLFQRGKFGEYDVLKTTSVVQVYAFGIVAYSMVRVFVQGFYAVKNTLIPAVVSAFCLLFHIIIAPILMAKWGIQGLAASSILSVFMNISFLMMAFHSKVGNLYLNKLFLSLGSFIVPSGFLFTVLWLYKKFVFLEGALLSALGLFVAITVAASLYLFAAKKLKVSEYKTFERVFRKRTQS